MSTERGMRRFIILAAIPFVVIPVAVLLSGRNPADASWVLVAIGTAGGLLALAALLRRR